MKQKSCGRLLPLEESKSLLEKTTVELSISWESVEDLLRHLQERSRWAGSKDELERKRVSA